MEIELKSFTPAEQATFRLRALYEQAGYRKYRASRFEEYALYQEYQRFLPDSQVHHLHRSGRQAARHQAPM